MTFPERPRRVANLGPSSMTTPFKQKVEERIQEKKDDTGGDQPAKRPCTGAEKQFKKLPGGDLTTVKEPLGPKEL